MSEPTLTSLRETADRLDEIMEVSSPWVHAKLTPMLRDATDVIEGLEHENAKLQDENDRLRSCLSDDAENARMIMGENAKLRELVREMMRFFEDGDYCTACEKRKECDAQEEYDDDCLMRGVFHARMRETGVEVDDGCDLV